MENAKTQRNKYDVAMELLKLHIDLTNRAGNFVNAEELDGLFKKYYQTVLNPREN